MTTSGLGTILNNLVKNILKRFRFTYSKMGTKPLKTKVNNVKQLCRTYFCPVFVEETSSTLILFNRSFFSLLLLIKEVIKSNWDCLTSPRFTLINSFIRGKTMAVVFIRAELEGNARVA